MTSPAPIPLDAETRAAERPVDHKAELRLWLKLLTCCNLVEAEIRRRLAAKFSVTLPRFDLLAQLDKAPDGLTLGETSRRMMVSNANVTTLVERLVADGLISRRADPSDRRTAYIRLTPEGRRAFAAMARAHEQWIAELFEDLDGEDVAGLMRLLGKAKLSVGRATADRRTR
ncbi:MAG TPA: MarR family transcriptional regulator [Aestuariivirgaceae bacterium]|nr:MarR family transcriptional regulator [Aestuariivirgaceae bacterium]